MKFNSLMAVLISFNLIFPMNGYSTPNDVVPLKIKKGDTFLKVTKTDEDSVRFEKCLWGIPSACSQVGSQHDYLISDLDYLRLKEKNQVIGSVGGAAVVIGALIFVGVEYALLSVEFPTTFIPSGTNIAFGIAKGTYLSAAMTTAYAGLRISKWFDPLNPFEQQRQADSIHRDVLTDKEVKVDNIDAFIERLELVLAKI